MYFVALYGANNKLREAFVGEEGGCKGNQQLISIRPPVFHI
jgi:hypothetical protein